jgi:hypothetical protein
MDKNLETGRMEKRAYNNWGRLNECVKKIVWMELIKSKSELNE